ncbi:MAG: Fe-S cluster assembly sulfur transfer protein SufU [Candidatus Aenigmatarchaeota archaeon]
MSLEIYQEMILEHYNSPNNRGNIENYDVAAKDSNPICGDEIEIQIKFDNGMMNDIKFQGSGCAISLSSVDVLIDLVKNKNIQEVKNITIEGFLKVLGIELSPLRLKCALLGLKTLKTAVYVYLDSLKS